MLKSDDDRKKDEWEKVRILSFYATTMHDIKRPVDLFPFTWDKKTDVKQIGRKDKEKRTKRAEKWLQNNFR